jgi:chromosome segregation protein
VFSVLFEVHPKSEQWDVNQRLRSSISEFGRRFDLRTSKTGTAEVANIEDVHPMPREVLQLARAS